MGFFSHRSTVEPPDPTWAGQPSLTGKTTVTYIDDPVALSRQAIASGAFNLRPGQYVRAYYDPKLDVIFAPKSDPEEDALMFHEWAHPAGWRHNSDGAGTNWAGSFKPAPMSAEDWTALLLAHGVGVGHPSSTGGMGEVGQRQPPRLTGGISPLDSGYRWEPPAPQSKIDFSHMTQAEPK